MTNKRAVEVLYIATCWNGCGRAGIDDLEEAIKMARAALYATEWISVKDRLPETGKDVIVCHKNGHVALNAYLDRRWWYLDDRNKITHWMPLPPAPKEDAE